MATQTVHFGAGSGVTAAKLYTPGSDTVVATGATPSQANNSKRWSSAFTDVTAGTYVLVATNSSGVVVADWRVKLAATTGDYHAFEYAGADAEQAGSGTDYSDQLDAIQAKTDLITTQTAVQQPLSVSEMTIIRGDSYDGTANAIKSFTVSVNYTGFTGTLTIRHRVTGASLMSVSVTVASSTLLTASLTTTNTAFATLADDTEFGPHPFDIEMVSGSSKRQAVRGICWIYKDQTSV